MPKLIFERSDNFVYDSSTLHYWPFSDQTGTTVSSFKPTGYGLTITDGTWTTGFKLNGWKSVSLYNGYMYNSDNQSTYNVGASDYFSFSSVVSGVTFTNYLILMSKVLALYPTSTGQVGYAIYLTSTDWYVYIQYGSINTQYSVATAAHNGNYEGMLTFTVDRANGVARFYKNGSYINEAAFSVATNGIDLSNSRTFNVGRMFVYNGTSPNYSNTYIAQVLFDTNKLWSAGDVWRIYKNTR